MHPLDPVVKVAINVVGISKADVEIQTDATELTAIDLLVTPEIPSSVLIPTLPEFDEECCMDVDLMPYLLSHKFDFIITNGQTHFKTRKAILKRASKFFENMLDGDSQISTFTVNISNELLIFLEKLIHKSNRLDLKFKYSFQNEKDLITLFAKYDIIFVKKFVEDWFQNGGHYDTNDGDNFSTIVQMVKDYHFPDLAEVIINVQQIGFNIQLEELETFVGYEGFICQFTKNYIHTKELKVEQYVHLMHHSREMKENASELKAILCKAIEERSKQFYKEALLGLTEHF